MPPRRGQRPARTHRQERENPTRIEEDVVDVVIEDLVRSHQPLNVLLAGPSGHGKSVLASFAPKTAHGPLILSTESGGTISAKRAGSWAKVIHTETWEQVVAAKKKADGLLGRGEWLVLDSLTTMQVLMVRWILRKNNQANEARDLDIPAIQDYQKWQNYFKRFVDSLITAPYNVIFICGDMIKENTDGDEIVLPHIEGKDYAICNYVRAQTSVNIYYAITDKAVDVDPETEEETGLPVRRALFQPYPPFVFPKDRTMSMGTYRDVFHEEFDIFSYWAAEMEEAIREAGSTTPEPTVTAPTPIRSRK